MWKRGYRTEVEGRKGEHIPRKEGMEGEQMPRKEGKEEQI